MSSILYKFKGDWQLPMIAFFMFISTSAIIAQNDGNETSETDVPWEVEVMENEFKAGEIIIEHIKHFKKSCNKKFSK